MIRFGLSAFLKLASLNPKPQRSEIAKRLTPSGSGYDFHRSLHLAIRRYLLRGEPLETIVSELRMIVGEPERKSALAGLSQIVEWRRTSGGPVHNFSLGSYDSPGGAFTIRFDGDFCLTYDGNITAIHAWNTKSVQLSDRVTYATLELFRPLLLEQGRSLDDLAVLNLRNRKLLRLSEAGDFTSVALGIVSDIESVVQSVQAELIRLPSSRPHPPTSPLPAP